jgi:hypothetical protein
MRFVHQTLPQRVVFASGDSPAAVAREIEALGRSKVLLIASDREEAQAAPILAQIPVVLRHDEVVMHVPAGVAARAREAAAACGAAIPGNNPRTVTEDSLTALLQAAWAGEEPS